MSGKLIIYPLIPNREKEERNRERSTSKREEENDKDRDSAQWGPRVLSHWAEVSLPLGWSEEPTMTRSTGRPVETRRVWTVSTRPRYSRARWARPFGGHLALGLGPWWSKHIWVRCAVGSIFAHRRSQVTDVLIRCWSESGGWGWKKELIGILASLWMKNQLGLSVVTQTNWFCFFYLLRGWSAWTQYWFLWYSLFRDALAILYLINTFYIFFISLFSTFFAQFHYLLRQSLSIIRSSWLGPSMYLAPKVLCETMKHKSFPIF